MHKTLLLSFLAIVHLALILIVPFASAQEQPTSDTLLLGTVKHRVEGFTASKDMLVDFTFTNHDPSKELKMEVKYEFLFAQSMTGRGIYQVKVKTEEREGKIKDLKIGSFSGDKPLIITLTLVELQGGKIVTKSNKREFSTTVR